MKLLKVIVAYCLGFFDSPFESDSQVPIPAVDKAAESYTRPTAPAHIYNDQYSWLAPTETPGKVYGDVNIPVKSISCNDASDRQKWCFGTNITTNYEDVTTAPNTGVIRDVGSSPRISA